jgi:NADH dehydrogenase [ubiquinone] 1 alpha subcomplex assembly factor 5
MRTHDQAAGAIVNPHMQDPTRQARAVAPADPITLFDGRALRLHRDRAARSGCVDFLHSEAAARLTDRLDDIGRPFRTVLDLGTYNGALSRAIERRPGTERIIAADLSFVFLRIGRGISVLLDPALVSFREQSFDLVVSALALHWVGDLPGALVQLRRVLRPDGLFLAAMLGGRTLAELRTVLFEAELAEEGGVSPRVSPAADLADMAALLMRAGFAMPVADTEAITVTYADAVSLMRDLRGMGETNALSARRRTPLRRSTLMHAAVLYAERFGLPDGRIQATFEILFLTGWAP